MRRQSAELASAIGVARAEGLSYAAIAERVGCCTRTVRYYLRPETRERARERRRGGYKGRGGPAMRAFEQLSILDLGELGEGAERPLSISRERSDPDA